MGKRSDLSGGISLRWTAALERARELADRPYAAGRAAPLPHPMRRVRVIGDPQTSLERFLAILDAHDLLGVDGFLADDVQLVSVGDHVPGEDGVAILRWLAEHAPTQAIIILGLDDDASVPDEQGELVAALLRAGRYRRDVAGVLADGRPVRLTHGELQGVGAGMNDPDVEPDHVPLLELSSISAI